MWAGLIADFETDFPIESILRARSILGCVA